jgi:cystathionine beta-lyase
MWKSQVTYLREKIMKYDFNKIITRRYTDSLKWDYCERSDSYEMLPMWVADMDFEAPREVIDAIIERAKHGIFGYTPVYDSYYKEVISWMKRRHGWDIKKNWIVTTPGVLPAVGLAILAHTRPGEKVVIQSPVYHPFQKVIRDNERFPIENRLKLVNGKYRMDYGDLEKQLEEKVRLLILCNPHNPVGRVWERDELKTLAEICIKHDVLIVSDEIHSDLIMKGYEHIPIAKLSDKIANHTVTFTSASKTFNLPGLACANVIIPNKELFYQFNHICNSISIGTPNIFGLVATEAAYGNGKEWLEQLLEYIEKNYEFLVSYMREHAPGIKVIPLEGTYLAWLDFRELRMSNEEIDALLLKEAKVCLDNGPRFGSGGEGFQRINLACPKKTLEQGLYRIVRAVKT